MTPEPSVTSSRPQRSALRTDIEGLRAVAVGLVVFYHLFPHRLHGGFIGVDIFFVISGFLITSHLIKRPPSGWTDLAQFWGRRARRLLPAAAVTLLVTVIAFRIFAPETLWRSTALDAIAATFYVANWRFAAQSVDYLGAESAPSPIQHFWSLSVEEQFYLVWPLLVLLVVLLRRGRSWTTAAFRPVTLIVIAGSLAYGIWLTETNSAAAYFVTTTRVWELAAGGLVATLVPLSQKRVPAWVPQASGWLGLAAVLLCGWFYTSSMPFPGYVAVLPIAGTALVIYATVSPQSVLGRIIGWKPFVWVGGLSYSLYLWHWPLITLVDSRLETRPWWLSLGILAASLALAWLSKHAIEDPLRRPRGRKPLRTAFAMAAGLMIIVTAAGSTQFWEVQQRRAQDNQAAVTLEQSGCFGAKALANPDRCDASLDSPISPASAAEDKPDIYPDGCLTPQPYDMKTCTYGDGPKKIAVVGNSHAAQWVNPLAKLADEKGWTITTYVAASCTASDATLGWKSLTRAQACKDWGAKVRKATEGDKYDLVIATDRNVQPVRGKKASTSYKAWYQGYLSYLQKWAAKDTPVLVLHDSPYPGGKIGAVPDCLEENADDLSQCSGTRDDWVPKDPLYAAAKDVHGIQRADLTDKICAPDRCDPIVGGVPVYFDESHMTATYTTSLTPYVDRVVERALSRS